MRFEGKHKEFKTAARGNCFKNILKTLALHHQRKAYNLSFNDQFASVSLSTGSSMLTKIFYCVSVYYFLYCSEGGFSLWTTTLQGYHSRPSFTHDEGRTA